MNALCVYVSVNTKTTIFIQWQAEAHSQMFLDDNVTLLLINIVQILALALNVYQTYVEVNLKDAETFNVVPSTAKNPYDLHCSTNVLMGLNSL